MHHLALTEVGPADAWCWLRKCFLVFLGFFFFVLDFNVYAVSYFCFFFEIVSCFYAWAAIFLFMLPMQLGWQVCAMVTS
jgi:hypothetical protein